MTKRARRAFCYPAVLALATAIAGAAGIDRAQPQLSENDAAMVPLQSGPIGTNVLVNNNAGAGATANFTQSETSTIAFGSTIIVGFNDSGSNAPSTNKFTGWSRSTDGGATWVDGGTLPTNLIGDAGTPVLARDELTGRIYFVTLGFSDGNAVPVFRSDDNGTTWQAPVNGAPGGSSEDKPWITVDNFGGAGRGNVYLASRRFGSGAGINLFRSTDGGSTYGPTGGIQISSGDEGVYIAVGPDHAVYVWWHAGATLQMRKSTDLGLTFGPAITVATGLVGGTNGDLGLTGIRQGTATASAFRTSEFPHAAVNPISGNLYVTYANHGAGADKADIFLVQSTDGGATWGAPFRVNDDAGTTDQWQPTVAVSQDGSRVGVFYYSRQEDPANNNLFMYYGRIGTVAGPTVTFQESFAVSDTPSLPEFGRDSVVNSTYMGGYDTVGVTPGFFHVVWSDNRDDLAGDAGRKDPNIYYAKIALGFSVTTTNPAVGSVLSTQPTVFTVNVSEPVTPGSLQAGDFTVNGIPATSVAYTPGATTMTFTFASSPVTAQGLQTMHVAAGAFTRSPDGAPVLEYTGTFRYDTVALAVVSSNPPPGGVFTQPSPFTLDLSFNEPITPGSLQTSDLLLSGIVGATVTGVTVLSGNTDAQFTITMPALAEGTLNVTLPAGTVGDAFGNPNVAFSASYIVDLGFVPYPGPLTPKLPLGSLIYDPVANGIINPPGDVDSFTIAVDPNQTITVLVSPSAPGLQPSVELRDPGNVVIGSATASAAGQPAWLQTVPAASGGTYTVTVGGASGSTGAYAVQLALNAAIEEETLGAPMNNTIATAQDLGPSFITLRTPQAFAERGAVMGTTDSSNYAAAAVPFEFDDISATGTVVAGLTGGDDVSVSIPIGFSFPFYGTSHTSVFVSSNGLLTFGSSNTGFTNADLTADPAQAAIAPFWDDQIVNGSGRVLFQVLGSGTTLRQVIQWNQTSFFSGGTANNTITYQAVLYADGSVRFNYPDLASGTAAGNNGGSASVGIKAAGTQGANRLLLAFNNGPNAFVGTGKSTLITPPTPTPDFYSFTASAGDVVTLAIEGGSGLNLDLRDGGGNVLATGVGGSTNLDKVVANVAVPAAGTYYTRVSGDTSTPYGLVITRNAAFDTEDNSTAATAQPIGGNRGALGSITQGGIYRASAVPFLFEDISATGTVIAGLTGGDDVSVSIPLGFPFPFYGTSHASVFVSSNGLLTFGTANTGFTNADLTADPTQAAIAPFWDDQIVSGAGRVLFQVLGSAASLRQVIQWNGTSLFSGGTANDTITYQAVLYADGSVRFNYQDLTSGTAPGNNGGSTTVGIKDAGTQGANRLLLAFNNGPNAFVGTGKSTVIAPSEQEDGYSVNVGGSTLRVETSTPADGPGEFVNSLDPHIELYDSANNLISAGVAQADGRNELIAATGLTPGVYLVRVSGDGGSTGEYFVTAASSTPPISPSGASLSIESCVPANGQMDPGERVTVGFGLRNNLAATTSNLVATLQSAGGVLYPTTPQSYGAVATGNTVVRSFAFTLDPALAPGSPITARLALQDGATNLGTASYSFVAGPTPCGGVRLVTSSTLTRTSASTVSATFTVQNTGTVPAGNVTLTTANVGATAGAPVPQSLGTIPPGGSASVTVTFTNSAPGVASVLTVGGTYTGGTFTSSVRVRVP